MSLPRAIEELSKNVTISLFSSPLYLQGAESIVSAKAPGALTNATKTTVLGFTQQNVYVYSLKCLFVSWGIAIFFTLFALILGFFSLVKNGFSYSNNFSTILRTTTHLDLGDVLLPENRTGSDPLPRRLEKRSLTLKTIGYGGGDFEAANNGRIRN